MSLSPCIVPNPDISGIGVRVSIYTQAFLGLVPLVLFAVDGKITRSERKALNTIYANILLTACALLISTFVQAATFGLTVYHAVIVLNLSWINNAGAIAWSYIDFFTEDSEEHGHWLWERLPLPFSKGLPSTLACAHLSAMAGLGIWVWVRMTAFDDQSLCTPEIMTSIFGHGIPVRSRPLSITSIVIYSITALPGINLMILVVLFILALMLVLSLLEATVLLIRVRRGWDPSPFARKLAFVGGPSLGAFLVLLFVVDTELMIRKNRGLVTEAESLWSFGQTLAMLMIMLPLVEVTKQGFNWYRGTYEEGEELSTSREKQMAERGSYPSSRSPLTV
jgi:hypothetical protein